MTIFEPGRATGLKVRGIFMVEPACEHSTRLIARGRIPGGAPAEINDEGRVELPSFIMQRKMLLGIGEQAEAAAGVRVET